MSFSLLSILLNLFATVNDAYTSELDYAEDQTCLLQQTTALVTQRKGMIQGMHSVLEIPAKQAAVAALTFNNSGELALVTSKSQRDSIFENWWRDLSEWGLGFVRWFNLWSTDLPNPAYRQQSLEIRSSDYKVFNVAFMSSLSGAGIMVGRYLMNENHYHQCNVNISGPIVHTNDSFGFARYDPKNPFLNETQFTALQIPDNVVCKAVGEPKWVSLHGQTYIYAYGYDCPPEMYNHLHGGFKTTYEASYYKSYLFRVNHDANYESIQSPSSKSNAAVLLATEERIEPSNPTAKNFLFFTHGNETLAITLVCPHRVYKLDLSSGLMVPAYDTPCRIPQDHAMGLGAGPLDLGDGTFLVAAHISEGGWGGLRQTFFYKMKAAPPFDVVGRTPPFSFGFDNYLEYITGLNKLGNDFIISLGIQDCTSRVAQIDKEQILSKFEPVS